MPGRQLAVLEDTYRQASHRLLLYYDVACLCFNSAHVTVHSVKAVGCMHCESSLSTVLQPDCGDSRNSSTVSISIICNLAHKKKKATTLVMHMQRRRYGQMGVTCQYADL